MTLELIKDLGMLYPTEKSKKKARYALFKCFCNKEFKSQFHLVNSKKVKSCGCMHKLVVVTHGLTNHRLYNCWNHMMRRCNNKNDKSFDNYGGRGITVCERWLNVANFIEDMYPSYQEGLSIDRIDVNGNYEPSNCRWATDAVQARNIRSLRKDNTTGFRGVFWNKQRNTFITRIKVNKKAKQLGSFKNKIEAAKAYDKYVIDNNLEHTRNFK